MEPARPVIPIHQSVLLITVVSKNVIRNNYITLGVSLILFTHIGFWQKGLLYVVKIQYSLGLILADLFKK
jgi:hypothetical protein